MNSITVNSASVSDILSALEGLGFTIDSNNNTAQWTKDTNNKIKFLVSTSGTNTLIKAVKSDGTTVVGNASYSVVTVASANPVRIIYETIGDGIAFGIMTATAQANNIHWIISAPVSQDDEWMYIPLASTLYIYNGSTENYIQVTSSAYYNGSANGIQIVKVYDGSRFMDNVYVTTVAPAIPAVLQANGNDYIEATIGSDTYLVANIGSQNQPYYNKIAIKKVSA